MSRFCFALLVFSAAAHAQTHLVTFAGSPGTKFFGRGLDVVPDVDGDGMADLLIGAPGTTSPTVIQGKVELRSSASGALLREWFSPTTSESFGLSVAALGDVDGDGVIDYAIGAPSRQLNGGSAYVFSGATGAQILRIVDDGAGREFGATIAAPGDTNGDGVPDLAIGDDFALNGSGDVTLVSGADGSEIQRWFGDTGDDRFGVSMAVLGDLDGDGVNELAIGAPTLYLSTERAYVDVYSCGVGNRIRRMLEPVNLESAFGLSVARCGDLDGDGFDEVVIGAARGSGGPPDFVDVRSPVTGAILYRWSEPNTNSNGYGLAVAGAGDVNGDGYDDIAAVAVEVLRLDVRSGRDGTLLYALPLSVGNAGNALLQGGLDRDRDGFPDLVLATSLVHQVSVIRGFDSPSVQSYCVAKTSSIGCVASAGFTGLPTLSGPDDFEVRFSQVHNGVAGIVYWGLARASSPFLGGTLCVQPPRQRTPLQASGGSPGALDCSGALEFSFTHAYLLQHALAAGTTVDVQAWFRDPGQSDGSNSGLTGGLEFVVQF